MAQKQSAPQFLARASYRQRRLRDVAAMVPILGGLLLVVPLLWPRGAGESQTSSAMIYIFAVWVILIGVALFLSKAIRSDPSEKIEGQDES